jgi:hypothetical protein
MHPRGVAMKADGLAGFSGIYWPPVRTQHTEQGLTTLARQGVMGGGFPAPGWHSAIIAQIFIENN